MDQQLREQISEIVKEEVTKVLLGTNQGPYNEEHFIQRIVDAVLFVEAQLEAEAKFARLARTQEELRVANVDLENCKRALRCTQKELSELESKLDAIADICGWKEKVCYECGNRYGQDE